MLADEPVGLIGELAAVCFENAPDLALGLALARLRHGLEDAGEQAAARRAAHGCFGDFRRERDVARQKERFEAMVISS